MKAVLCDRKGNARVSDIPRPSPDTSEVLIRVDRVQLSVTECQYLTGKAPLDRFEDRLRDGAAQLFGHEFCGTVVESGSGVTEFSEGDRVFAPGKVRCHECVYCDRGNYKYCENKVTLGFQRPGALAEYITSPPEALARLPADVTDSEGAALQPLVASIAYVSSAGIETGDIVVVIGTGVMGVQCGQIALQHGAGDVIAVDIDQEKLALAEKYGLKTVNARENPVDEIQALTDEVGADIVFEAVGGQQSHATKGSDPLAQAFQMVRPGGDIVQVGNIIGEVTHHPRKMAKKNVNWINLVGDVISTGPNMDSGKLAAQLLNTERISISDYITHSVTSLEEFSEAVQITVNKDEYGARGPCQIDLTGGT